MQDKTENAEEETNDQTKSWKEKAEDEKEETNLTSCMRWRLRRRWEVKADDGWLPWDPQLDVTDCQDHLLTFSEGEHEYGVLFKSSLEGFQLNLDTGKWRKLRQAGRLSAETEGENKDDSGFLTRDQINRVKSGDADVEVFAAGFNRKSRSATIRLSQKTLREGLDWEAPLREVIEFVATRADPRKYLKTSAMKVSGGTAAFHSLTVTEDDEPSAPCRSVSRFVGKDLSHAPAEIIFYEDAKKVSTEANDSGIRNLLDFMFEYEGVLTNAQTTEEGERKELRMLVLRNLFDGCKCLRMMDIKIGQKTADAGWYGKSDMKALVHKAIDENTNSIAEGFRLAGFNGAPLSVTSRDPLVVSTVLASAVKKDPKKAAQALFSQMSGAEMFNAFLDVHQEPADISAEVLDTVRAPTEVAEIVLHEVVRRLVSLVVACREVIVPQKWVGSSIAIGFDCGDLPPRDCPESVLRDNVRVNIFDWGRSELNTVRRHNALSTEERADRLNFWSYYRGGADRLAWEAIRCYRHRFGNDVPWGTARAIIYDFDCTTADDYLGDVELLLEEHAGERTVPLVTGKRKGEPSLTYSVEKRYFPRPDSRLREAWRIHIRRAERLPIGDRLSRSSDPYVVLIATSTDGRLQFRQQSSVKAKTLNPEWDETFELPVSMKSGEDSLMKVLELEHAEGLGEAMKDGRAEVMFPPEGCAQSQFELAEQAWLNHLAECTDEKLRIGSNKSLRTSLTQIAGEGVRLSLFNVIARIRKRIQRRSASGGSRSRRSPRGRGSSDGERSPAASGDLCIKGKPAASGSPPICSVASSASSTSEASTVAIGNTAPDERETVDGATSERKASELYNSPLATPGGEQLAAVTTSKMESSVPIEKVDETALSKAPSHSPLYIDI